MAGKCKEMNKIKQALRLHLDGESNRSIGRQLDLYKGTVNKYITLAESCGIPIPVLLAMEEPEIERVLTGGNPAYSDSRFQDLKERLPYIASELERKHMTMFLLWREYRTGNPDGYGYTQFCYHVNQYTEAQKPSFVLSPDREGGQYLGGGGFLQVILKKNVTKDMLHTKLRGFFPDSEIDVWECNIDF